MKRNWRMQAEYSIGWFKGHVTACCVDWVLLGLANVGLLVQVKT